MSERRAKRPEAEVAEDVSEDPEEPQETEEEAIEAEPEPEPVAPYEALVVDPSQEEAAEPEPQVEAVPEGHVRIVYRADAPGSTLTHGDYKFRSDEPVTVPSEVAEELLTQPFEVFELL
jgi:hypothetical protein